MSPIRSLVIGQKRGWAGFRSTGWPWLVEWVSTRASPTAVWTPDLVLLRDSFCLFICLFVFSLFHKYLVSVCLVDLKSHQYRDWGDKFQSQLCHLQTHKLTFTQFSHFTPLSLFPFLQSEDSVFPTNHWMVVKFKWDDVCTNPFKVKRIIIEMYIFPDGWSPRLLQEMCSAAGHWGPENESLWGPGQGG